MKYHLDSMLPIRAFSPRSGRARGFAAGGMTLEGDSGSSQYWQQEDQGPSQVWFDNLPSADQGGGGEPQGSVTVEGAPASDNSFQGGGGGGAVDQGTLNNLYQQYLGRGVDPSGAASWTGQDYNTVVQGLLGSQEYASRGGDQGGGGGGLSGIGATTGGAMVGGGLSGMDSGAAPTNETEFVNKLYHDMFNRAPDEGAQNWINALQSGQMTPQDVANSFVSSQEAQQNGKSQSIEQQIADAIAAGYSGTSISPADKTTWQQGAMKPDSYYADPENRQYYYTDPKTGNVYNSNDENAQLIAKGSVFKDANIAALGLDPVDAQNLYNLKSTDSNAYYKEVANQLAQQTYDVSKLNGNADALNSQLQSLKTENPAAYYQAQLDLVSKQAGWQVGQNRGDRAQPMLDQIKTLAADAQSAGVKYDDIKAIVDKGFQTGNIENQQRIARDAESGGSGFNFQKDLQPGLVMLALATAAAMTAQPELLGLGEAGAAGGTAAGTGMTGGAGIGMTGGATGGIGLTGAAGTTAASTMPAWVTAAGQGALTGATMGGINAGVSGGDVGQGILRGGLTGAVGGGLGNFAGGAFSSPMLGQVIGGAGAGAAGSALTGGNIGRGALYGGGGGLLNYGLGQIPGLQSTPGQFGFSDLARGAISGGTLTSAMGGNFGQGALSGASGAYLSNMMSPYISGAYNKAFGSPNNINVSSNQPVSPMYPEGSGYAGNGSYKPLPAEIANVTGTSPYVKTDFEFEHPTVPEFDFGSLSTAEPGGVSYKPGDIITSKVDPNSSLELNPDGSLTARTAEGEQHIPEKYANATLEYVLNQNKQHDAYWKDYIPGEDYAGPRQSGMMNIPSTYEGYNTQDMLNYPESKGAGFYEQMQDVADISGSLKAGQSNIPGTEDYNPAMSTIELPNVGELDVKTSLDLPEPFLPSEGTRQDTNSTGEKQTVSQLDKDLQTGEITQKEYDREIDKLAEKAVENGLVTKTEAKNLSKEEIVKVAEQRENDALGKKGTGPGLTLANEGSGRGEEEGPLGALGTQGITGDIAAMASFAAEPGLGEDGTGEGEGEGGEGEGGGGGGGGGGGTGGTGKGTGSPSSGKPGGGLPYIYKPQPVYRAGVAPNNPGITNLTPGLTKANQNYGLAGLLPTSEPKNPMFHDNEMPLFHAATGGLATTGTNQTGQNTGTAESLTPGVTSHTVDYILSGIVPLGKATGGAASTADLFNDKGAYNYANVSDSKLTPALTKHKIDYLLAGLPPIGKAEGGGIHTPEFYSEGGASMANRYVKGNGDGTSDSIPAMLANGEFVIPADIVSNLGNGSNDSGAKVLDEFLRVIRQHKQKHDVKRLPPNSKGPLAYLTDAKRKVKK